MKRRIAVVAVSLSMFLAGASAIAQEAAPAAAPKADEHEMKAVEIGPEAKVLHRCDGKWTFEMKMMMQPGKTETATGTRNCKVILGGLGIAYDIESKGPHGGMTGYGMTIWNPTTKKYDSAWADSYSWNGLTLGEGTWDDKTKTLTETMVTKMPDGSAMTMRGEMKHVGDDKEVQTFFGKGPDGKEFQMMEISSTRAK